MESFIGVQIQVPPIYSAIKVNGRKLYEYARSGEKIDIPERKIEIYDICLNDIDIDDNEIVFKVKCSKGTYIRTLCEDIAKKLGTVGYMKELNRIQVGQFNIDNSISIDELRKNCSDAEFLKSHIISIDEILKKNSKIILTKREIYKLMNGVKFEKDLNDGVYKVCNENNEFLGTAIIKNKMVKRDIIL